MPSINVEFADAGSLIFAGPIAISRKKTGTGSRNYLKIAKRSTIPSWSRHVQRDHRVWIVCIQGRKCKLPQKSHKARPRNSERSTIVYFTENFPVTAGWFPKEQIPITFLFTKLVPCLPCDHGLGLKLVESWSNKISPKSWSAIK